MGPLDTELVEDRHRVGDAKRHRVVLRVVGLIAATEPSVVHVDEPELVGGQRRGEAGVPHQLNRVKQASMKHDRGVIAPVVLEVDPASVPPVPRVRHDRRNHLTAGAANSSLPLRARE